MAREARKLRWKRPTAPDATYVYPTLFFHTEEPCFAFRVPRAFAPKADAVIWSLLPVINRSGHGSWKLKRSSLLLANVDRDLFGVQNPELEILDQRGRSLFALAAIPTRGGMIEYPDERAADGQRIARAALKALERAEARSTIRINEPL